VKRSALAALFNRAITERYHRWHERDFSATTAGIHVLNRAQDEAAREGRALPWGQGYGAGVCRYLSISTPVSAQLEWLRRLRPRYLVTYPSNLDALLSGDEPLQGLDQVMTFAEALPEGLRARCLERWGAKLVDAYSAQEVGVIALQCPSADHYHVVAEHVLVELVRNDGRACEIGESGRVLVTDLHNFVMPLLRYEIGDYAEAGAPCACGRGLPALSRIMGRARNMLLLPSGDRVWPRFHSDDLATCAPVSKFQLVQKAVDRVDARLVVARPLSASEEQALRDLMVERLGGSVRVRLDFVEDIERNPGRKYEDFVSEIA
jgi:phenylacetate-CoA ligase